jgi:hypothetical protein
MAKTKMMLDMVVKMPMEVQKSVRIKMKEAIMM